MLAYLLISGRWAAYFRHFRAASSGAMSQRALGSDLLTALLWLIALAPVTFAAWEIGRDHVAARRLGYELVVGFREVCRRAFTSTTRDSQVFHPEHFSRPPADRPGAAVVWGGVIAVLVPTFFASFSPDLRTARGLLWLGIAGLLMGLSMYCRRRAMAYLDDEPGRWDMFREWRLLNPDRYEPAGRIFVRWQIVVAILLPIWWLGGGAALIFHS